MSSWSFHALPTFRRYSSVASRAGSNAGGSSRKLRRLRALVDGQPRPATLSETGPIVCGMSRRALALVVVVVVAAAMGGWVAGRALAPREVEPVVVPPPVTVEVEKRALETKVVARGSVGVTESLPLAVAADGVVTSLPMSGDDVLHGQVLLTVGQRPVIAVESPVVFTSNMTEGSWGIEVGALQDLLDGFGYDMEELDGRFGQSTAAAVAAWYLDLGFVPLTTLPLSTADSSAVLAFLREGEREGLVDRLVRREVVVPASELLAVASLPLRVEDVSVRVGEPWTPGSVTASTGETQVVAVLSHTDAVAIDVGADAVVDEPGVLAPVAGAVVSKDQDPQNPSAARITIRPEAGSDLSGFVGASVRVVFPQHSTGEPVLAVPLAAISAGSGGSGVVEVVEAQGNRTVEVDLGLSADGFVEVTPRGPLRAGELVVIRGEG